MVTSGKLSNEDESLEINQSMHRSMIGILLYLIASRSNTMQVVGLVSRFQANPKQTHRNVVKRKFKYLQVTLDYGLWYPKGKKFYLNAFTDAYWASSIDGRKST